MDIEKLIESAEHCDLGDCANCPSCGRVCCKERTMGELAREVKRLQAENEKLRAELEQVKQKYEEVREAICTHCMDFPCREESCFWWRGQEEG